jgi:hypothetical protein
MKQHINLLERIPLVRLGFILILFAFFSIPVSACTIFILTDGNRVLFFNNEDWTNPKTRIWFVPAGEGYYGCSYVGYNDGWARGGVNTEGLACDWVGGYMEKWEPDSRTCVRGNPTQRLLESCATVEEAIAFFRTHREPDFTRAKILVADRMGTSVIIGARDGKLQVEKAIRSRGFGYANRILDEMLPKISEPSIVNGVSILQACLQKGKYATKYSNVFDLKSGDIYLFQFHQQGDTVKLNLSTELNKGGHYYDMPEIRQQLAQASLPLPMNMKRFFLDEFPTIHDPELNITNYIRATISDAISGNMHQADYTAEFWKAISPVQKDMQIDLKRYGDFVSIALVDHKIENGKRSYRYRVDFEKITMLLHYVLDEQNKVLLMQPEGSELKPGADLGE